MPKSSRAVPAVVLTLALTVPALVWAQAVPRGSGSSGGGSGSSNGSSSSGGGSGPSSSGSSDSGSSGPTYSPPPMRTPPPPRPSSGGARTGSAVPRGGSSSESPSSVGSDRPSSMTGESAGRSNPNDGSNVRSRNRDGRPASGVAVPRQTGILDYGYLGSLNRWSPSYGSGLSWYYGYPYYSPFVSYSSYSPFLYNRWMWARYGMWYDPYGPWGYYDPFYLDPVYGGYGSGGYGYGGYTYSGSPGAYSSSAVREVSEATGSVRLRVKPANGKVYLDGTLVGIVDEFDGLTTHLAATAGRHEIEIRADGFEPLKLLVDVPEDQTVTARGSLRKK